MSSPSGHHASSIFVHEPLKSSDSIRVLTLKAGSDFSPIHVSLTDIALDATAYRRDRAAEHLQENTGGRTSISFTNGSEILYHDDPAIFECVSYPWGDPILTDTIFVDDLPLEVTANLHSVLRHFRYDSRPRHLWIDAVCINQEDDEEKGHQVYIMGKIYAQAMRVLTWLGESSPDTEAALSSFPLLFRLLELDGYLTLEPDGAIVIDTESFQHAYPAFAFLGDYSIRSLTTILDLPWFTRLWVVQEFAVARSVGPLSCGTYAINWELLHACIQVCQEALKYDRFTTTPLRLFSSKMECANTILWIRLIVSEAISGPKVYSPTILWLTLPWSLKGFKCRDDRDRIYAVLNLLRDDRQDIAKSRPNYRQTVAQAYKQYVQGYFERYNEASIATSKEPLFDRVGLYLHRDPHIPSSAQDLDDPSYLPSWAVDLRTSFNPYLDILDQIRLEGLSLQNQSEVDPEPHSMKKIASKCLPKLPILPGSMSCEDQRTRRAEKGLNPIHMFWQLHALTLSDHSSQGIGFEYTATRVGFSGQTVDSISSVYRPKSYEPDQLSWMQNTAIDLKQWLGTTLSISPARLERTTLVQLLSLVPTHSWSNSSDEQAWMATENIFLSKFNWLGDFKTTSATSPYLYFCRIRDTLLHAVVFVTKNGRVGLGPRSIAPFLRHGELVVFFTGVERPFIVLPHQFGSEDKIDQDYSLLGPAYVQRLDKQRVEGGTERPSQCQKFWLV